MAVDFARARKEAEAAGMLGSGDYFKLKEGKNRFRLMSECLAHPGEYKGAKNFKWLCYVLDRLDGKVKPFFMAHTIYKQIEALQTDDDYAFNDVPMPYDVTVNAKGAGTKEVEYAVIPSPARKALIIEEQEALDDMQPLAELQKKLREKAPAPSQPRNDVPDLTDDDVPFAWLLPLVLPALGALSLWA
jgi:hypothetical protein